MTYTIGQQVTVIDGGWTGDIARIDTETRTAWLRFSDRPDYLPYAFEALRLSDYEHAADRFERISRSLPEIIKAAQAVIDWANDEYDAAQDNLRRYESRPGIPLQHPGPIGMEV